MADYGKIAFSVLTQAAAKPFSDYIQEKWSQADNIMKLDMNLRRLRSVLDETWGLPITCLEKRHDLKLLKDAYKKGRDLLESFQPQQADTGLLSKVSSALKCLTSTDVQTYEYCADKAEKLFKKLNSTCACDECNPRKNPNPNTLVRHLLEGETIRYASQEGSRCMIRPVRLQERGVESVLWYRFLDLNRPGKCYVITLFLRVRESTDLVGMAMKCLKSLPSQLEDVRKFAMTQVKLLADTKGTINISHAPQDDGFEAWYEETTLELRPDSFCCKNRGKNTNSTSSSESLSGMFPEEIILFSFNCNAARDISEDSKPPLKVDLHFIPHGVAGCTGGSVELEETGGKKEEYDVVRQQEYHAIEECFFRQPELTKYRFSWLTNHGVALIAVEKSTFLEAMHSFEKVTQGRVLDPKKRIQVGLQVLRSMQEEWPQWSAEVQPYVRRLERRLEKFAEELAQQEPQRSAEIQPRRGTCNL